MAYESDPKKNRQIAVSVAIQAAVDLAKSTDDPYSNFAATVGDIVEKVVELQNEYAIKDEFPGTTVDEAPAAPATTFVAPVIPIQPAPSAPAAGPAPIPGATDGDPKVAAYWAQFFADPSKWWDNRESKDSPNKPDFRHKTQKDGKYNVGLYLDDKKNPSWVAQALVQAGLA